MQTFTKQLQKMSRLNTREAIAQALSFLEIDVHDSKFYIYYKNGKAEDYVFIYKHQIIDSENMTGKVEDIDELADFILYNYPNITEITLA